jgi:hypothetical protein
MKGEGHTDKSSSKGGHEQKLRNTDIVHGQHLTNDSQNYFLL